MHNNNDIIMLNNISSNKNINASKYYILTAKVIIAIKN